MTKELETKIEILESNVAALTLKINEIVSCLEDNKLFRKIGVDYIEEEEDEEEEEIPKETPEETPKESKA